MRNEKPLLVAQRNGSFQKTMTAPGPDGVYSNKQGPIQTMNCTALFDHDNDFYGRGRAKRQKDRPHKAES